ncbi:P-type conjugative transfer protein TrbG [Caulobacter sp. Root1472]|uniref:P-type conjugative transfer protein TrbG n=1 Tax=Caulobacter sp. Root1472 TaxID=1736470 RepID=UPI0006FAB962|nr:P-type conjugative transfer protein TrbG [Caulobacter sp. Root1472]KQZ29033.1 conjugal transfer protein TrbG [Caulobacter sp. Root1472]
MIRLLSIAALASVLGAAQALAAATAETPQGVVFTEFQFAERGVDDLVAAPGRITDIVLEPGETLVQSHPIAAGDTVRWVIGDTTSGEGANRRVHVLVKPVQADLATNLIINTNRRTYHLQLRASSRAFLSQIAWRYPAAATPPTAVFPPPGPAPVIVVPPPAPDPARLNFGYRLKGAAPWRPERVFDDGARTYVEFGPTVALNDLPPLFIAGPDGRTSELVNYRVVGRRLVVDRLFDHAQLRFGLKRWERRIRIDRQQSDREVGQ